MPQSKYNRTPFTMFLCFVILLIVADTSVRALHRSLQNALMHGDMTTAQRLLRYHVTPDEASFRFALNNAVMGGDEKTVRTILVYQPHLSLTQALCNAARAKSPNIVRLLLSYGADPNGEGSTGNSVLAFCLAADEAERKQSIPTSLGKSSAVRQEMLQLLRRGGAHLNLYDAIYFGDVNDLKVQLERGVDPNACPDSSVTALTHAYIILKARKGGEDGALVSRRRKVITLLHTYGAHCRFQEAVRCGLSDELKWHLAHGADPNTRMYNGYPLLLAAAVGNTEMVRILLDHGAKVDVASPNGRTALMLARAKGHLEMVHLLLDRGADSHLAMRQ